MRYGFGIDLGGTTCKIGLFLDNGKLVDSWEIETDKKDAGKRILEDIAHSIGAKMDDEGIPSEDVIGIGIGVPGAVTDGIVNKCVNLGWGIVDVAARLEGLTGIKAFVENDANTAAYGEFMAGAGKRYNSAILVTLGTGVGGGIILDGRIINGFSGAGGEIGHIIVNQDEKEQCNCGHRGCLEQYTSATGIVRCMHLALEASDVECALRDVEDFTCKDVFDKAREGDLLCAAVVRETMGILGKTLASICAICNPKAVIIGGGVSKAGQIVIDSIGETFYKDLYHACAGTELCLAQLGNTAGIYGAFYLIKQNS